VQIFLQPKAVFEAGPLAWAQVPEDFCLRLLSFNFKQMARGRGVFASKR